MKTLRFASGWSGLDDDERVEQAAQELARRIREHERIQRRAREILDEDEVEDEDEDE